MVKVKIGIKAYSDKDTYLRYHGLTIDRDLPPSFWTADPGTIIGISTTPFTWEKEFDLTEGRHYLVYGNSSIKELPWTAEIYINGRMVARGSNISREQYLKVEFTVGAAPIPVIPKLTTRDIIIAVAAAAGGVAIGAATKRAALGLGIGLGAAGAYIAYKVLRG
jgi:hypothetical protein